MRDTLEKYVTMPSLFANKAGELHRILETQKRLVDGLLSEKHSEQVKALLVSVAEGHQVGLDLLTYMKLLVQGVADDVDALKEGSAIRNINKMQAEEIESLWNKLEELKLK